MNWETAGFGLFIIALLGLLIVAALKTRHAHESKDMKELDADSPDFIQIITHDMDHNIGAHD